VKSYEKKSIGLISLKAKIKGYEAVAKSILREARNVTGERRASLKFKKNAIGDICRHHLAAYAVIRGVPLVHVEKKCREGNCLKGDLFLSILLEHEPFRRIKTENGCRYLKWSMDDVNELLTHADDVRKNEVT